jgi:citrate synthase
MNMEEDAKQSKDVNTRLTGIEAQLREIFTAVNNPIEEMNLMQLRVAAYRKIKSAVEYIDRVLEMIDTEFITEADMDDVPSVVFLNKQQEEQHNAELHEVASQLREIRWLLVSPPENYQHGKEIAETGTDGS